MATVQQVLNYAYAKSSKNQPATIGTEAVELLEEVQRILTGAFQIAGVVNPIRMATSTPVVGVGSVWARPAAAETIFRIEDATGAEVAVVPIDDKLCCEPQKALFELGSDFIADAGQTNPPGATDTLTFFYSSWPVRPTPDDLTGTIDPLFPDAYVNLLSLQLAIYLSRKDGRMDEVQVLAEERNAWLGRYVAWLQHGTANLQKRIGQKRVHAVETLIPLLGG